MATFSKIRGIIGNIFSIGVDGPQLKDNAGVLEVRDATDAAFQLLRAATPIGSDDVVTKAYHDANPPGGSLQAIEIPFGFGDVGTTVSSTFAAAVGGRVSMVKVDVTTVFDVDPASFTIGDSGQADRFVLDDDVKLTKVGLYEFPQYTDTIASTFDIAIGAAGGITTGAARALVLYTVPAA